MHTFPLKVIQSHFLQRLNSEKKTLEKAIIANSNSKSLQKLYSNYPSPISSHIEWNIFQAKKICIFEIDKK